MGSALSSNKFAYYGYRSPFTGSPTCADGTTPQYSKADACWSIDDTYKQSFFRVRQVPGGGEATRFASFLKAYLESHSGEDLAIVAHSEGGVLAVYTLKEKLSSAYAARIKAIVTLDSPLGGINGAARPWLATHSGCPNDNRYDSPYDMDPTSSVIRRINDSDNPSTRLLTVDAVPGYFGLHIAAIDEAHSTTWWATTKIQVAATYHGYVWSGCFIDAGGCPVNQNGTDLGTQGRRLVRFAACGIADLASDCANYADQ